MGKSEDAKTVAKRRLPGSLTLKKEDTLKDIRMAIAENYRIQIMLQRIWYKGREIEDSSESVESMGITEHETLQVLEVSADEPLDMSRTRGGKKAKSGKSNGRMEGFAGTGLHSFEADTQAAIELSLRDAEAESPNAKRDRTSSDSEDYKHKRRKTGGEEEEDRELAMALLRSSPPWNCSECTFENDVKSSVCNVCMTPR